MRASNLKALTSQRLTRTTIEQLDCDQGTSVGGPLSRSDCMRATKLSVAIFLVRVSPHAVVAAVTKTVVALGLAFRRGRRTTSAGP